MVYPTNLYLTKQINLQLADGGEPAVIYAKQYDSASRYLSIALYDGETIYSIPEGAAASLRATKPDGKTVIADCTVESDRIIAELPAQLLSAVGRVRADVMLALSRSTLSAAVFFIDVCGAGADADALESTDDVRDVYKRLDDAASEKIAEMNEICEKFGDTASKSYVDDAIADALTGVVGNRNYVWQASSVSEAVSSKTIEFDISQKEMLNRAWISVKGIKWYTSSVNDWFFDTYPLFALIPAGGCTLAGDAVPVRTVGINSGSWKCGLTAEITETDKTVTLKLSVSDTDNAALFEYIGIIIP